MTSRSRGLIIGGVLLATLAAGALIDDQPVPLTAAKDTRSARSDAATDSARGRDATRSGDPAAAPLEFPQPTAGPAPDQQTGVDPFRRESWRVAAPPPSPAKPVAPPLPFQYLGMVSDGDAVRVFLAAPGKHLIAATGDVIDDVYLVAAISGKRMTFVYLPLREKQVLSIGSDR